METGSHAKTEAGMLASLKFCEQCKGSIPDSALHDGHALFIGKKPVHVDCLLKRSATLPVLGVLLGLVGIGLGLYALATKGGAPAKAASSEAAGVADRALEAAEKAGTAAQAATADLAALKQQLLDLAAARGSADGGEKAATEAAAARKQAADAAAAAADLAARLQKAEEALTQGASRWEAVGALDGKFNALSQAVTDLRKEVLKLKPAAQDK